MKKTLLALAVAALSANAFAVDLDAGTGTQVFAKEITVAAAGTDVGANVVTASTAAGFSVPQGFIRFDLDNGAKFKANPVLTVGGIAAANITVASGGAGQSFVIFQVAAAIGVADVVTLTSANGITVVNQNAVNTTYGLYDTAANASNKTTPLKTKSGALLSFAQALTVAASSASPLRIDAISSESKKFVGPVDSTSLVNLSVGVAAPAPLLATGVAVATPNDIIASTSWKIGGNFSAVAASGLTASDAATIANDKQSVSLANNAGATAVQTVNYKVTGNDEIAETGVSAVFTPVAKAGFTLAASSFDKVVDLVKNGTTESVDLALKPGGTYSDYVRISNKDTISGAFFIKVINDAGASVSFPLSSVANQPASLAAGASTSQMTIQSIFDAASAKGLALSGDGKLRLEVTGQVNALSVQSYTVSKDGNSFATF